LAIRFLLDEDVPDWLLRALRSAHSGLDVVAVGAANAPGCETPDADLLTWCEQTGRILVSRDKRTMPIHYAEHLASGGHVPGVLLILTRAPLTAVLESLDLIVTASRPEEWRDRITYLPL
jgi:hypothetical protein